MAFLVEVIRIRGWIRHPCMDQEHFTHSQAIKQKLKPVMLDHSWSEDNAIKIKQRGIFVLLAGWFIQSWSGSDYLSYLAHLIRKESTIGLVRLRIPSGTAWHDLAIHRPNRFSFILHIVNKASRKRITSLQRYRQTPFARPYCCSNLRVDVHRFLMSQPHLFCRDTLQILDSFDLEVRSPHIYSPPERMMHAFFRKTIGMVQRLNFI